MKFPVRRVFGSHLNVINQIITPSRRNQVASRFLPWTSDYFLLCLDGILESDENDNMNKSTFFGAFYVLD